MREMMTSDDFTDVTLVTDDKKTIKAHRNILSACTQKQRSAERRNSFDFLMSSIGDTQSCCCTTRVVTQYIGKFYFPLKKTV